MGLSLPPAGIADAASFREQTRSRLPSYRRNSIALNSSSNRNSPDEMAVMTMTLPSSLLTHSSTVHSPSSSAALTKHQQLPLSPAARTIINTGNPSQQQQKRQHLSPPPASPSHARNRSTSIVATSPASPKCRPSPRPKTISDFSSIEAALQLDPPQTQTKVSTTGNPPVSRRKVPASNSRNDFGLDGPPPAMITRRTFPLEPINTTTTTTQTQDWVASIAQDQPPPPLPPTPAKSSRSSTGSTQLRPLILPIRAFKPSTRRSLDSAAKRSPHPMDPDSTIRALEGFEEHRPAHQMEQEEHNSDESDLFLRAAREEELAQRTNPHGDRLIRSDKRRVRNSHRGGILSILSSLLRSWAFICMLQRSSSISLLTLKHLVPDLSTCITTPHQHNIPHLHESSSRV